jgi:CRISPR-associated exonuclease Cas4
MISYSVSVNTIKQWVFCPRIVYFNELLAIKPPVPPWVSFGSEHQREQAKKMRQRKLNRFGIQKGHLDYDIFLRSEKIRLHGRADAVLVQKNEVSPVDFKAGASMHPNLEMQLTAYAMLLEEKYSFPAKYGYLLFGDKAKVVKIKISDSGRNSVLKLRDRIVHTILSQEMPDTAASMSKCSQCEYQNMCNDRE